MYEKPLFTVIIEQPHIYVLHDHHVIGCEVPILIVVVVLQFEVHIFLLYIILFIYDFPKKHYIIKLNAKREIKEFNFCIPSSIFP